MPGVGSRSSCDACRKRKKKCDKKLPMCSSCKRLGTECKGGDEIEYKWRPYKTPNASPTGPLLTSHGSIRLAPSPTNDVARTGSSLACILDIEDPGRSILTFGTWLQEIPRRMEQSPVLAAAAKALTRSVRTFYWREPVMPAVKHYGRALETLRGDLVCAVDKTQCVDRICAIGVLCLASNLMELDRVDYEVHVRGLLSLLKRMPDVDLTSDFEKQNVAIAWSLVIGECIMDPGIEIDSELSERHRRRHGSVATGPVPLTTESHSLRWENLMSLPRHLKDPVLYHAELAATYKDMLQEGPRLVETAEQLSRTASLTGQQSDSFRCILSETGCVELLSMSLVLNRTLRILDPSMAAALDVHSMALISEIIETARRLDRFRPLGTARLPNAMCLAWVAAPTPGLKEAMRKVLDDHVLDFRGVTWEELAARYQRRFRGICARVEATRQQQQQQQAWAVQG